MNNYLFGLQQTVATLLTTQNGCNIDYYMSFSSPTLPISVNSDDCRLLFYMPRSKGIHIPRQHGRPISVNSDYCRLLLYMPRSNEFHISTSTWSTDQRKQWRLQAVVVRATFKRHPRIISTSTWSTDERKQWLLLCLPRSNGIHASSSPRQHGRPISVNSDDCRLLLYMLRSNSMQSSASTSINMDS